MMRRFQCVYAREYCVNDPTIQRDKKSTALSATEWIQFDLFRFDYRIGRVCTLGIMGICQNKLSFLHCTHIFCVYTYIYCDIYVYYSLHTPTHTHTLTPLKNGTEKQQHQQFVQVLRLGQLAPTKELARTLLAL